MKNKIYITMICLLFMILQNAKSDEYLKLLMPAGGEIFCWDSTYTITWVNEDSTSYADIYLWDGSTKQWSTIATNILQLNCQYQWTVSSALIGNLFRIKIQSQSSIANSFCNGYISIIPGPQHANDIKDIDMDSDEVILYPNPVYKELNIKINMLNINFIRIINIFGESVFICKTEKNENFTINANNFIEGIYFLECKMINGLIIRRKFIKIN